MTSNQTTWAIVIIAAILLGSIIANATTINKLKTDNNLK